MSAETLKVVDLGCGPNKVPGAVGVDQFCFEGVDILCNLGSRGWPIQDNSFDLIHARHLVEHVADVVVFMNEVHRIGRDGAEVHIVTPHFTSNDSYADPTHVRHLAIRWHETFTKNYLKGAVPPFEHVSTRLKFGSKVINLLPKLAIRWLGDLWWEKNLCFLFPARNIHTVLRICKGK